METDATRTPLPTAVLWDMDGTLIDQTAGIVRCFGEVVAGLGLPRPDETTLRRSMGGPMVETMGLFVPPDRLDEACRAFRTRFPEVMFEGLVILPGALTILAALAGRGIPQAIFTNKHGPTAREVSRHAGFDAYIPACIGQSDTPWHKPEPELTRHVLRELGVEAEGAVLVGDSPTDVATARAAGLPCWGVATGAHAADELLAVGAVAAFPGLPDLGRAWGLPSPA